MMMNREEFLEYIDSAITPEIESFVSESLFEHYLIYRRIDRKTASMRCTHCGELITAPAAYVKHNEMTTCPACGVLCTGKAASYARSIVNRGYFVTFKHCSLDPDALVALGMYVIRQTGYFDEMLGSIPKPVTSYVIEDMYLFRIGMLTEHYKHSWWRCSPNYRGFNTYRLDRVKAVSDRSQAAGIRSIVHKVDLKSLGIAVKGTVWEKFMSYRMTECEALPYLDLAARKPCVEYLCKMGFSGIVSDAITPGHHTYSAVNWRGKTAEKVLRLKMQDIRQLAKMKSNVNCGLLKLLQYDRKMGGTLRPDQLNGLGPCHVPDILKLGDWCEVTRYIVGQKGSSLNLMRDLHDYWDECKKLNMDLKKKAIKWPKDLHRAHELTTKAMKVKADAKTNEMIMCRMLGNANIYTYTHGDYTMRPARSSDELIAEGNALHHCVAGYAQRYAKGEITICFIRLVASPDEPLYTAEFNNKGHCVQCRGSRNCSAPKAVTDMIAAAEKEIAKKLKMKKQEAA